MILTAIGSAVYLSCYSLNLYNLISFSLSLVHTLIVSHTMKKNKSNLPFLEDDEETTDHTLVSLHTYPPYLISS